MDNTLKNITNNKFVLHSNSNRQSHVIETQQYFSVPNNKSNRPNQNSTKNKQSKHNKANGKHTSQATTRVQQHGLINVNHVYANTNGNINQHQPQPLENNRGVLHTILDFFTTTICSCMSSRNHN